MELGKILVIQQLVLLEQVLFILLKQQVLQQQVLTFLNHLIMIHLGNLYLIQANFGNGYFGTTAVSSAGTNASGNRNI
jgi:hypothetical protein